VRTVALALEFTILLWAVVYTACVYFVWRTPTDASHNWNYMRAVALQIVGCIFYTVSRWF
jgi:hypothetical protein